MRIGQRASIWLGLLGLLAAGQLVSAQAQFTEMREPYTSGVTPYGDWQLGSGIGFTWVSIATPRRDGSGKCYRGAAVQESRSVWTKELWRLPWSQGLDVDFMHIYKRGADWMQ